MTLSVKPYSKKDESLISYLLRLIVRNGFREPGEYFNRSFINAVSKGRLSKDVVKIQASNFEHFSHFTQFEYDAISHPIFKRNHIYTPRICPSCAREEGILKKDWQKATTTHCPTHNTLLIDTCSHCEQALKWGTELLTGNCTNTGCNKFLFHHNPNKALFALNESQILDCFTAAYFLENIGCTNVTPLLTSRFDSHTASFLSGYYFLTQKPKVSDWYLGLNTLHIENSDVPDELKNVSASILIKSLKSEWPLANFIHSISKESKQGKHLPARATQSKEPLVFNLKQALTLLNFQKEDVRKLINVGLLNMTNDVLNQQSKMNFHLLIDFLRSSSSPIKKAVTYYELEQMGILYLVNFCDLLVGCYEGKIPFQYNPKASLKSSVFFEPGSVQAFALNYIKSIKNELTSVTNIMDMTGMSVDDISLAIKKKIISKPQLLRNSRHLKNRDLVRLIKMKNSTQLELNIF
ncbi:TniQ family protein [Thalassotalea nanhaiensis]|uniref:TniQ family protein n=1 Tax=Thalassotalea nanhaiensis TaxID=3065648 RepID=A0ABY9TGY4_9GAMM|nr:TniQ family protein [Colwelliaceae bacterium SQ345]